MKAKIEVIYSCLFHYFLKRIHTSNFLLQRYNQPQLEESDSSPELLICSVIVLLMPCNFKFMYSIFSQTHDTNT